jgi:hypothetical protein
MKKTTTKTARSPVQTENESLREKVRQLENRIMDASFLLCDWDGYYDPEKQTGNVRELASLVEEAFTKLQGRSWRDANPEEEKDE